MIQISRAMNHLIRFNRLPKNLSDFLLITALLSWNCWKIVSPIGPAAKQYNVPSNPWPLNGQTGVATSLDLSWSCSDSNGSPLTYYVYYKSGRSGDEFVVDSWRPTVPLSGLDPGTTYQWWVVAVDTSGTETTGPTWSFTTYGNMNKNEDSLRTIDFRKGI